MPILYGLTIFVGAALLFVVQPMFARMLLPLLGGAPAVWNTSMVFFQATLLAAYAYAHWLGNRWRPSRQMLLHGAVLLLGLIAVPIHLPAWTPPAQTNPIPWLLEMAAVGVGLPFFAVAATSPLLQRWLATSDHPAARDPYFLYAASNFGSLVALISYPVLVEPHWTVPQQGRWWAVGYGVLIALIAACAARVWRATGETAAVPGDAPADSGGDDIPWRRRLRWVLLAFVPSSLMLSVTNYISMDLAAIPLLWVIPLAIYLATFSLAFARWRWRWSIFRRMLQFLLILIVIMMGMHANEPLALLIPLHLAGLFAAGMVCHRELAADRPPARDLTAFYLWVAVGGVLGGAFNALVAPLLFTSVAEYPLGLLAACLLMPRAVRACWADLWWPAGLLAAGVGLVLGLNHWPALTDSAIAQRAVFAVPALVCYSFSARPMRYALGLLVVLVVGGLQERHGNRLLLAERTFFGIHRVVADDDGQWHRLFHGTTVHGMQRLDPASRGEPLTYFTRSGPLGQVFAALSGSDPHPVGVIGLGAGSIAAFAVAGESWTFYEIDPTVERIARDPRYFTFLRDCPARLGVVLGDARLTLRGAPDGNYRLLILDAYNSDAIPLHLITRQALALYLRKLRPDGILAWHITNRHLDLEPVVAALARDAGLICLIQLEVKIAPEQLRQGKAPSYWAVMARETAHLGRLTSDARWRPARQQETVGVWKDDYVNLLSVLHWHLVGDDDPSNRPSGRTNAPSDGARR